MAVVASPPAKALLPALRRVWLDQPARRGVAGGLAIAIVAASGWLMSDPLQTFVLQLDDFHYLADSRTPARLAGALWQANNAHIIPLFRIWSFTLVSLAGKLERLPVVVGPAAFGALAILMLLAGRFVARETASAAMGLAVMAFLGVSTVMQPATVWYSAGQALWAAMAIAGMLLALQRWRINGSLWPLGLAVVLGLAAPGFWSGGFAAGPVGSAYLWADGRRRCRHAAIVPIVIVGLAAVAVLVLRGRELVAGERFVERTVPMATRLANGTGSTAQAICERLAFANLGVDVPTHRVQAFVLCLALAGVWRMTRRTPGALNPLEAAGGILVIMSYGLIFTFRGSLAYENLRNLGWYDAIPQAGAALFLAGWLFARPAGAAPTPRPGPLTCGGALRVVALVAILLVLQAPRAARMFAWSGLSRAETVQRASLEAARQRDLLQRLDRAERIARQHRIGRKQIRAVFGRILGPAMPREIPSLDAAELVDLAWEGHDADLAQTEQALEETLRPFAERPPAVPLQGPR